MNRSLRRQIAFVSLLLACAGSEAAADGLRCSAFLLNSDGSWRSFDEADVIGPRGPVHLEGGERLDPFAKTAKGDLARALTELCAGR